MHTFLTIIAFIFIFSLLILIHECGHFFVAKWKGIKIEEFGFGLPPRIWGKKYGETLYSLNWIPFGGFVRMLGEDARDKKAMKNSRSFMRMSKWARTQVVCAGVLMNFLLAWVLFSAGFMVGMQPLIVNGDDFLASVRNGQIKMEQGVVVDSVVEGSWAEANGFERGVLIETVNGASLGTSYEALMSLESDQVVSINGIPFEGEGELGLQFNVFEIPRVILESGNGFQVGDLVMTVDGEELFFADEFIEKLSGEAPMVMGVLRHGTLESVVYSPSSPMVFEGPRIVISKVLPGSPAEQVGLLERDRVVGVNGMEVLISQDVLDIVSSSDSSTIVYDVLREGVLQSYTMERGEDGLIGVMLGELESGGGLVFYDSGALSSIVEIENVKYPFYEAPWQALVEMKHIGGVTMVMIGKLFGNILTTASVPEEVSGPVGIAQMTGIYVQEGFVALMRFTGLLSLSLAIINIFPFPALDGGRQFFIIIEAIRGKPLDTRIEGYIHSVGFIFLMLVILLVTLQDVGRLFT